MLSLLCRQYQNIEVIYKYRHTVSLRLVKTKYFKSSEFSRLEIFSYSTPFMCSTEHSTLTGPLFIKGIGADITWLHVFTTSSISFPFKLCSKWTGTFTKTMKWISIPPSPCHIQCHCRRCSRMSFQESKGAAEQKWERPVHLKIQANNFTIFSNLFLNVDETVDLWGLA